MKTNKRLQTDAAFFNDVRPIIELVSALQAANEDSTRYVDEHTSARIVLTGFLPLVAGRGRRLSS